jgi:hypothetical protein
MIVKEISYIPRNMCIPRRVWSPAMMPGRDDSATSQLRRVTQDRETDPPSLAASVPIPPGTFPRLFPGL